VITEQESNLNGCNLMERIDRALYFYTSLFDSLDSTTRTSVERLKPSFLVSKYRTSLLVRELIERRGMRRLRNE
jgi:hypothetical protein